MEDQDTRCGFCGDDDKELHNGFCSDDCWRGYCSETFYDD
tara:strand:+ start:4663 stop:4782 length:120 start_codon:yes stop_codon:yes gene_type:complete